MNRRAFVTGLGAVVAAPVAVAVQQRGKVWRSRHPRVSARNDEARSVTGRASGDSFGALGW